MLFLSHLFSFLLLIFSSLHSLCAQDTVDGLISIKENAVRSVGFALAREMAPSVWCDVGKTCLTDSDTCALHGCSGGTFGGDDYQCTEDVIVAEQPNLCSNSDKPNGILLNFNRPFFWTPQGSVATTGEGKPMTVANENLRRDICTLRNMESDLLEAYRKNSVSEWLYAGTSHGAFSIVPGNALLRDPNGFDGCGFDPLQRPWYIAAASGPKDIVFLLDATPSNVKSTILFSALKTIIKGLDIRDFVSIVAVGGPASPLTLLGEFESLKRATALNKERLIDALDNLSPSSGNPNYGAAFEKAFDILSTATASDSTSGCNKLIVLLSFKEDECFLACTGGTQCDCIQKVRAIISEKQETFDEPVSIVSFSEGPSKNTERVARTIVCDKTSSGIWRRVTEGDTNRTAMSTYSLIVSAFLFDENPNVFASEIYEDIAGLGDVFTLALPVYVNDEKRLVGVAGADITVKEVEKLLGDASQARTEIGKLSLKSRNCNRVDRDVESCEFQALRAHPNSAVCADIFPKGPEDSTRQFFNCYKLGESVYGLIPELLVSWDDAAAQCRSANESKLARIDGPGKNTFISSIVDADGSWIGLRAETSSELLWQEDTTVQEYDEFSFSVAEVLENVHEMENFAACATMDRRGISGNWNIEVCSALRTFVCELSPAAIEARCKENIFDPRGSSGSTYIPTNNVQCAQLSGPTTNCTDEEKEDIQAANPLCKESNVEFTTEDRKCCGGKADGLFVEAGPSSSPSAPPTGLGVGAIVGIAIGAVSCLLIVTLVIFGYRKYRKEGDISDGAAGRDVEMPPHSGIGGVGDAANGGVTGAGAATVGNVGSSSNEGKDKSAPVSTASRATTAAEEDPFASPFVAGALGDEEVYSDVVEEFGEDKPFGEENGNTMLNNYGY